MSIYNDLICYPRGRLSNKFFLGSSSFLSWNYSKISKCSFYSDFFLIFGYIKLPIRTLQWKPSFHKWFNIYVKFTNILNAIPICWGVHEFPYACISYWNYIVCNPKLCVCVSNYINTDITAVGLTASGRESLEPHARCSLASTSRESKLLNASVVLRTFTLREPMRRNPAASFTAIDYDNEWFSDTEYVFKLYVWIFWWMLINLNM